VTREVTGIDKVFGDLAPLQKSVNHPHAAVGILNVFAVADPQRSLRSHAENLVVSLA